MDNYLREYGFSKSEISNNTLDSTVAEQLKKDCALLQSQTKNAELQTEVRPAKNNAGCTERARSSVKGLQLLYK